MPAYICIVMILIAILTLFLSQKCFIYKIVGQIYVEQGDATNENGETYMRYGYEDVPVDTVGYNILFKSDNADKYELEAKNQWTTLSYIVVVSLFLSLVLSYLWTQNPEKFQLFWVIPPISTISLWALSRLFVLDGKCRVNYEGSYQLNRIIYTDALPSTNLTLTYVFLILAFIYALCAKSNYRLFKKKSFSQSKQISDSAPQDNSANLDSSTTIVEPESLWYCVRCGKENIPQGNYCSSCGTKRP